jgi:putative ubiquitin-RnfH superfamily antitoxin RatB of RatAB toxin-antitoxin module
MADAAVPVRIEVVLAYPEQAWRVDLSLPSGATVADALALARALPGFPPVEIGPEDVGVFGRKVAFDHGLQAGDRLELYRPLTADPKDARRKRAGHSG